MRLVWPDVIVFDFSRLAGWVATGFDRDVAAAASGEGPSLAPAEVVAQLGALGDDVSTGPMGRDEAGVAEHRDVL